MEWQLAEAKNRFSELVSLALGGGIQRVRRRNQAVVIIAEEEYERLIGQRKSFKDYLLAAPDMNGLDFSRDASPMRDAGL